MYSSKNSEYVTNSIKRRRTNLKKVFHSKCCLCGFNAIPEALEFHHVNPAEKSFGISSSNAATKSLNSQLEEMKKCILVCANCHRGIHSGVLQVPENYKDFYDSEVAQSLRDELERLTTHQDRYCIRCGKAVSSKAQYCPECASFMQRKVERPSREQLKELIRHTSFLQIGRQYGVADNTIRKWCKAYGLPHKVTEINLISDEDWKKI